MFDIQREDRRGIEVIHRHVEKALNLRRVQVQRQDAVNTSGGDQVRDQLGRNRRAGAGAAILAGIAEIGDHGGDATRGRAAQRIRDDQQFHQVVVRGVRCRLDDEHILAADILVNLDIDLLVVEPLDAGVDQIDIHAPVHRHAAGNRARQGAVRIPRNQLGFGHQRHRIFLWQKGRNSPPTMRPLLAPQREICNGFVTDVCENIAVLKPLQQSVVKAVRGKRRFRPRAGPSRRQSAPAVARLPAPRPRRRSTGNTWRPHLAACGAGCGAGRRTGCCPRRGSSGCDLLRQNLPPGARPCYLRRGPDPATDHPADRRQTAPTDSGVWKTAARRACGGIRIPVRVWGRKSRLPRRPSDRSWCHQRSPRQCRLSTSSRPPSNPARPAHWQNARRPYGRAGQRHGPHRSRRGSRPAYRACLFRSAA
ncbi:hypothetical protein KVU_0458 [Ketogulonicigenium vulgare WSH-001]|uniref:Uncharacterized protein n=1 Tax=Ketogulonicigenium vulgare (strain WSH-001) TaxID=759362 RepID=F9YAC4_KETVW|nr:hypothetical protein KVU_0458 [Ketogulonicigenium vulgare WSH-001]